MIEYIETHLTHHCNLNCRSCTHYAPLAKPWFKDIHEYIKEIARLAELTDNYIPTIRLLGGEPLLHSMVIDFCYITRQAFPNSHIELVTNGILLPNMDNNFYNTMNEHNIAIYLSDYNLSQNIKSTLEEKLKPDLIRMGSRGTMIKPALHLTEATSSKDVFQTCRQLFGEHCTNLRDGYIYHCPTAAYFDFLLEYFGLELKNFSITNNGINIFDNDISAIKAFLNSPSDFCKYCDMQEKVIPRQFGLSKKQISEWLS